ncbi:NAD-dependent epimerase/dehydratase family protein [Paenibacillus segetis]|uniref:NAD dependent epimerase/dehydratase n=1 Tax=Paenibacillus segetis TaxID=1325360 RepID=A0ABQ1YC23_9BACL|nr:NAD-dependent epimerase/dehydratase family protein [Paenibacillus segetis]GGH19278.1 NAD dependent epimerase/dehydratase [Paenibacillus segetis]
MSNILVLGGSRYFGKRLVDLLLHEGIHNVTVATRGLTEVNYDGPVQRLILNRTDQQDLKKAAVAGPWDVVYDNICYSPNDALAAIDTFDGQVGRYILTSTLSVYDCAEYALKETAFDPYQYPLRKGNTSDFNYAEGKRQSEAAFFQHANFPVCAMRIPIVLGPDDYTKRLHFHVERVMNGTPIGVPNPEAAMSLITSAQSASFLHWLASAPITGPVNACSDGKLKIREIISLIEKETGATAVIKADTEPTDMSPFGIPSNWYMDTSKARKAGYSFDKINDWLPDLIGDIASGRA